MVGTPVDPLLYIMPGLTPERVCSGELWWWFALSHRATDYKFYTITGSKESTTVVPVKWSEDNATTTSDFMGTETQSI